MNARKPLVVLAALCALLITVLATVPYALTLVKEAGREVVASAGTVAHKVSPGVAAEETRAAVAEVQRPLAPQFDVALWYGARGEEPEKHGVLVESLDGKQAFASHNADTPFNPASLLKLSTSLFALRRLGAEHRFTTQVLLDGALDAGGTLQGDLYLDGNDPSFNDTTATLLARELKARGVKRVKGKILVTPGFSFNLSESAEDSAKFAARVMKLGESSTGAAEQARGQASLTIESNPLRQVLLYMNAHSVNFIADRIGNQLGGPDALAQFLRTELKVPAEQISLQSCSGLYENRMTPRVLLGVLRALNDETRRQNLQPDDVLPVASCDAGTLRRRMAGTGYEGAVVGKTGTLTTTDGGMSNLSGLVYTKDEGVILFAILSQGRSIWNNKQMTDELLAEVVHEHQPACVADPLQTRRQLLPPSEIRIETADGGTLNAERSKSKV